MARIMGRTLVNKKKPDNKWKTFKTQSAFFMKNVLRLIFETTEIWTSRYKLMLEIASLDFQRVNDFI